MCSIGRDGKIIDQMMSDGKLIDDVMMIRLMRERLQRNDCDQGFILDGFPRSIEQAVKLDELSAVVPDLHTNRHRPGVFQYRRILSTTI